MVHFYVGRLEQVWVICVINKLLASNSSGKDRNIVSVYLMSTSDFILNWKFAVGFRICRLVELGSSLGHPLTMDVVMQGVISKKGKSK